MIVEMVRRLALGIAGALVTGLATAVAAPPQVTVPNTVRLPTFDTLFPACSDPAADHFLEVDISKRPPAGATPVKPSAWVTSDGVFHWPFVMRVRNIGDQPFMGKAGLQSAVVTEDDLAGKTKGRVVGSTPFDRIDAHSGVAVRFEFTAPAEAVQKARFHRIYTLSIKYQEMSEAIVNGRYGDCNLRNNSFFVEFDGSRKGWIFGK